VTVRLTPRDEVLLRALARFRVARTSDLVRFAFRDVRRDTAAARLRRLYDGGWLDVRFHDRANENLYSLGPEGRRWLKTNGGNIGRLPREPLAHHLAIVRTWVDLAIAFHDLPDLRLAAVRPDWELREGRDGLGIVPDLLVRVRSGEGFPEETTLAVEVDLGTETLGVLRRKIVNYQSNPLSDLVLAVAFCNCPPARLASVRKLLREEWTGPWVSWSEDTGPRGAVEQVLGLVQRPLTDSPSPKGRAGAATDLLATNHEVRGEGL
jgi:hypothetical protein